MTEKSNINTRSALIGFGIAAALGASIIGIMGTGPDVGDLPTEVVNSEKIEFKYFTVVTVKYAPDGKISSSFGKFDSPKSLTKKDADTKVSQMVATWTGLTEDDPRKWDAYKASDYPKYSGYDFDIKTYGYKNPNRIYVVLVNESLRFDKNKPVSIVKYSFQDPNGSKYKITKNKAFYNANVWDKFPPGIGGVLYLETHLTKPGFLGFGKSKIDSTREQLHYSVNFNLWAKAAPRPGGTPSGTEIPTVIDPDTGNGLGWGP